MVSYARWAALASRVEAVLSSPALTNASFALAGPLDVGSLEELYKTLLQTYDAAPQVT